MFTLTTNSSGKELGESVIFQPVLQVYLTCHSWIIMAHVSLGHLKHHLKAFNRQLIRTRQLVHFLGQQPSAPTQLLSMLQVELTNIEDIHSTPPIMKLLLTKKLPITKENLCTKYTPFIYKYVVLNEKPPIMKQNLHIFFFIIGRVECIQLLQNYYSICN